MAVAYFVGPIKRQQVDKTYRLIEAAGYNVDFRAWRDLCAMAFARNWPAPFAEEVITAENPLGYVAGVCIMRPVHDRMYGRVLEVPVFIVVSAGGTRAASNSLLGFLSATARNKNCGFIRVMSHEPEKWPRSADVSRRRGGILIPVD
ncbi:hypothetical protein SM0020_05782 [Sinorhizobium meliloti CCNWSX0020]|uniref:Uncharacterized protein n=1 Tax=Sinorhizobium meliloti CCNWSX0020 TaxID=1107881 RepID=H0FVM5_RHIML|nr:hypothetical protein [Sinorhizobium meliloti]EHK78931.1 hypothetical protein SM0020_05782 [Sinorhizobium meliloti CCNWSX0020]RVE89637.1 hypothetical protein CN238_13260 [Sinorhizobium meliloti]RVG66255.1 hypothetical protein CN220_23435 [Sinorhizobium meliloti]RVH31368.1 hypothetical protein CN214_12415 [Sinorhizobium meliloti]RVH34766.1 hypothetical protein CN211_15475 [Sinorhizobium meliloti]